MTLNASVPRFECFVRKEFLYDLQSHHGDLEPATVFGVSSLQGRAIGFHALLDNGSVMWRLPLHALVWRVDDYSVDEAMELSDLELWDCFSYQVAVTVFEHLAEMRVLAYLGTTNKAYPGVYMFTLDWYGSPYAESAGPGGHKCAHVVKLDNGWFCAQPNNRLAWHEPAVVTLDTDGPTAKPDYKIMTRTWKVENGHAWAAGDGWAYDVAPVAPVTEEI